MLRLPGPLLAPVTTQLPRTSAATATGSAATRAANAPTPPVLTAMQEELDRSMSILPKADPGVYFLSYTVSDRSFTTVSGSNGALLNSTEDRGRWLEVQARTGNYELDDTHKLGDRPNWTSPGTSVALDDDLAVLRHEIWRETDRQFRASAQALIRVTTSQKVQVQTARAPPPISRVRRRMSLSARASISGRSQTLGRARAPLYRRVQQVARGAQFHRHVHRAGDQSVSGEFRRHQAGLRTDSLSPRTFRAEQSARRHGHQPLRQFRLARSQGCAGREDRDWRSCRP